MLLGLPKSLLGALWTPKTLKNILFFKVFANAAFWYFKVLDVLMGVVLAHLGPF